VRETDQRSLVPAVSMTLLLLLLRMLAAEGPLQSPHLFPDLHAPLPGRVSSDFVFLSCSITLPARLASTVRSIG